MMVFPRKGINGQRFHYGGLVGGNNDPLVLRTARSEGNDVEGSAVTD
jgi:hypothetical protein